MQINTVLAVISGGLAIGQALPYVRSMLMGRTKPSRVACAISVVCNICLVSSLVLSGNTGGLVLPLVFLATGLVTLVLSFKFGMGGFTKFDLVAASVAALAIISWLIMGTNGAVIGTNTAQATALVATFNKLRKNPGTEDLVSWSIGGSAALVSLIAVYLTGGMTVATMILPIRCVLSCLAILALALIQYRAAHPRTLARAVAGLHLPHLLSKSHHFDLAA